MEQKRELSDHTFWIIGAAASAFGLVLGNVVLAYVPDQYYDAARVTLLLIPAAAAFFVAAKSKTSGLAKALLYIPLIGGLALALTLTALALGVNVGPSSAADMANQLGLVVLLFAPPILIGAVAGWGYRRLRG